MIRRLTTRGTSWAGVLAALAALIHAGDAKAGMSLTPAGIAEGFTLSTFIDTVPNSGGVGPLGVAFNGDGTVLVSDDPGNVRLLPNDNDGQHASPGQVTQNYGSGNAIDMAQVGGAIYMTRQAIGDLVQINTDGTFNQVIVGGMPAATGMAADPFTGHLFVSTLGNNAIWDVDPIGKTKTLFVNASADGLTLSPDGSTLYAEVGGHILGYDTTTKTQVFDSGSIPGGPDGAAAGTGSLAGKLYVNTNSGQLFEINIGTLSQTLIASGGSRGDFVTVDPTNGTLLLTQTDSILRLTPPAGGGFLATPEPATLVQAGLGLLVLAGYGWRRRKAAGEVIA